MLQTGPAGRVGDTALGLAGDNPIKYLADAGQSRGHHQVAGQHTTAGVDNSFLTQAPQA